MKAGTRGGRAALPLVATAAIVAGVTGIALLATGVLPQDTTGSAAQGPAGQGYSRAAEAVGDPGDRAATAEPTEPEPPADPVRAFLDTYVEADGRVVRIDEGGDTVSEGQAYGLLLATAADDEDQVRAIWAWTEENLVGPDGMMAWRWEDGAVVDQNSATDADMDAAWALVVAGERFDDPTLTADGVALAEAVARETIQPLDSGQALLAGPWVEGPPWLINPSYANPGATATLAAVTGDPVWPDLATTDAALVDELLTRAALPPDWAQVDAAGQVEIMPPPGGGEVGFGLDAARVPVRLAASCDAADQQRAAALAPVLRGPASAPGRRDLGGTGTVEWSHPLADVAAASALAAAGDSEAARERLDRAARLDARNPTYYGAAWVALADVLLVREDVGLRDCAPLLPEENA